MKATPSEDVIQDVSSYYKARMKDVSAYKLSYREMTTDDLGSIVSYEAKRALRKQYGYCLTCTDIPVLLYTVKKSRLGPLWSSRKALNVDGRSRDGVCLKCNPEMSGNDSRRNLFTKNDSTRSLQSTSSHSAGSNYNTNKRNPSSSSIGSTASASMPDMGYGSMHSAFSSQGSYRLRSNQPVIDNGYGGGLDRYLDRNRCLDRAYPERLSDDGTNASRVSNRTAPERVIGPGSIPPPPQSPHSVASPAMGMRIPENQRISRTESIRTLPAQHFGEFGVDQRSLEHTQHDRNRMQRTQSLRSWLETGESMRPSTERSHSSRSSFPQRSSSISHGLDQPYFDDTIEEGGMYRGPPISDRRRMNGLSQSMREYDNYRMQTPNNRSKRQLRPLGSSESLEEIPCGARHSVSRPRRRPNSASMNRNRTSHSDNSSVGGCDFEAPAVVVRVPYNDGRSMQRNRTSHSDSSSLSGCDFQAPAVVRVPHNDGPPQRSMQRNRTSHSDSSSVGGYDFEAPAVVRVPRHDRPLRSDFEAPAVVQVPHNDAPVRSKENDTTRHESSHGGYGQGKVENMVVRELKSFFADLNAGGACELFAEAVANAMGSHNEEEAVLAFCLHTVRNSFDDNVAGVETFVSSGGHRQIVSAMKTFPSSFDVQEKGCAAIDLLIVNQSCRQEIIDSGAYEAIENALRRFPSEVSLVLYAFAALRSFTQGLTKEELAQTRSSLSTAILKAMQCGHSLASIQRNGCELIASIFNANPDQYSLEIRSQVIQTLVAVLETHMKKNLVTMSACRAIHGLVDADDACLLMLSRIHDMKELLFEVKSIGSDNKDASSLLEKLELCKTHNLEDEALEKFMQAIMDKPKQPQLVEEVLETLRTSLWSQKLTVACLKALQSVAASSKACEETLREKLTVDQVVDLIQEYGSDAEVQEEARALAGVLIGTQA